MWDAKSHWAQSFALCFIRKNMFQKYLFFNFRATVSEISDLVILITVILYKTIQKYFCDLTLEVINIYIYFFKKTIRLLHGLSSELSERNIHYFTYLWNQTRLRMHFFCWVFSWCWVFILWDIYYICSSTYYLMSILNAMQTYRL